MNKTNQARLIAGVLIATLSQGLAAPVNDNFADAIVLPSDNGTLSGNNNIGATLETGEPECYYPETDNTVWFKWVCTQAGNFTLSSEGSTNEAASEWDAVLCLYTGSTLATLEEVVKQDAGVPESLTVAVTPGTYYIQAGGYPYPPPDTATDITLTWSLAIPPPPITEVVSIDVVRSDSTAVSGDVAGSPVTGQTGEWNRLEGSSMPATLSDLTDGSGGATGVGLTATFSGSAGFQGSGSVSGVVLAGDDPERLWVTGTGSTLTLTLTGLSVGGNYGLVIYNTGNTNGNITINGGTTHTAVDTIFTSSEVADGSGNITAVVGHVGEPHTGDGYMEVSGLQVYPLAGPPALAADAGADQEVTPGSPSVEIGGSPSASGGTGPYTYSWDPTTGLDDPTAANPTASPTVTTTYTLTVTDSLAAEATSEVTVTYTVPDLVADAGADQTVTPGSPSVVIGGSPSASGGSGTYTYSWEPTTGLDDPTAANPTASPTDTTVYTLTVTDSLGTPEAIDEVTVTFEIPPPSNSNLICVDFIQSGGTPCSGDTVLTGTATMLNADGIGFTGQSGSWNALNIGTYNNTNAVSGFLTDGAGTETTVTLALGTGTGVGDPGGWRCNPNEGASGGADQLRAEEAYLYNGVITGDHYAWAFTGLTPNGAYKLVWFGDLGNASGASNLANVVAGTRDSEGDWNWDSVTADGSGTILGTFTAPNPTLGLYGVQIEAIGGAPSGYAAWAGLHAGGQTPDLDYNHDGVANGIAYFMGENGLATNPALVAGKVTWPQVNDVASFAVEVSDNLTDWSPANPDDIDTTTDPGFVIYHLPTIAPKQFCRLVVTP